MQFDQPLTSGGIVVLAPGAQKLLRGGRHVSTVALDLEKFNRKFLSDYDSAKKTTKKMDHPDSGGVFLLM